MTSHAFGAAGAPLRGGSRRPVTLLCMAAIPFVLTACTSEDPALSPGGDMIVQAFLAYASDEDLTMHVTYEGSTAIRADDGSVSETFTVTGEMDADGDDFAGSISIVSDGGATRAEVVRVDGVSYVRPESGVWQIVEDDGSQPVNPFAELESNAEVEYVGETEWRDQTLHHLRTDKWLGDDPASMESETLTDVALMDHGFDIFVTDAGVPAGGELTAELAASVNGRAATITNSYVYTFDKVGQGVTIEAPLPGPEAPRTDVGPGPAATDPTS